MKGDFTMKIMYHAEGTNRKALADAISRITGVRKVYKGIMGPLSRPHSKILRVSEENLFYAAKRLKYSLSGTSYPSAS